MHSEPEGRSSLPDGLSNRMVRTQLDGFRGRAVNTTGDGFIATFDGPARAVQCGQVILDGARSLGLDVRVGVHVGECETRGDDLAGIAVHIGARVCATNGASSPPRPRTGSGCCGNRGSAQPAGGVDGKRRR